MKKPVNLEELKRQEIKTLKSQVAAHETVATHRTFSAQEKAIVKKTKDRLAELTKGE